MKASLELPEARLLTLEPDVRPLMDRTLRRRLKRRCQRMLTAVGLQHVELSVLLAGDRTETPCLYGGNPGTAIKFLSSLLATKQVLDCI